MTGRLAARVTMARNMEEDKQLADSSVDQIATLM